MEKRLSFTAIIFLVALSSLLALLPVRSCMASPVDETKQTITMSMEQYNKQLKTLKQQEEVLMQLKRKMEMLEAPLTEQVLLLDKCEKELSTAKENLQKQEISLNQLSNSIEVLRQDLKILEKQIQKIQKQSRHRMNQRNMYALLCLLLAGFAAGK